MIFLKFAVHTVLLTQEDYDGKRAAVQPLVRARSAAKRQKGGNEKNGENLFNTSSFGSTRNLFLYCKAFSLSNILQLGVSQITSKHRKSC